MGVFTLFCFNHPLSGGSSEPLLAKPLPGGSSEPLLDGSSGDPLRDILEAILGEGDTIQLQNKIKKQLQAFFHLGRQKIGRLAEIFKSIFALLSWVNENTQA